MGSTVQASTYPDMPYTGPNLIPAFPEGFTVFTPPVHDDGLIAGTPAVSEWTRSCAPGSSIALTGEELSLHSGDAEGRDTRFILYGNESSTNTADGLIQQLDGQQAAIMLPTDLISDRMYLMWPRNGNGAGEPVAINQAEAWWVGPARAAPGKRFAVYGRNLVLGDGLSHLYIEDTRIDEDKRWLTSVSADPYRAEFQLPDTIPNGTYTVWAHNGHGDKYGWAAPLTLTVTDAYSYDGTTINVKTEFGAVGDGSTDDFAAIDAAFHAARDGDTVYFPPGTYLISDTLFSVGHNKRILGAGRDVTTLATHPTFQSTATWGMIICEDGARNLEFSDITLSSGQYPSSGGIQYSFRLAEDMTFSGVRFTQLDDLDHGQYGPPVLAFEGAQNMVLTNCDFIIGGDVTVGDAVGVIFDDCRFYGINDCNHMVTPIGVRNMSVMNCTAQSYDDSNPTDGHGWAKGRFIAGSGNLGKANRNIYFANNTTTDMAPRNAPGVDSNAGEQFMFEGLVTRYRGSPTVITPYTLKFSGLNADLTGNIVAIISGKGLAQNRDVVACDVASGTITLDRPWRVSPDESSILVIGSYMSQVAVYDNYFDATLWAVTNVNEVASVGFESYGGCFDAVVDGNTFHQLRAAIDLWSMSEPLNGVTTLQPNYFNLFVNNDLVDCKVGINNRTAFWNEPYHADIGLLGNVFRKNDIQNMELWAVGATAWKSYESMQMCIYEGNTIQDTPTALNLMDHRFWGTVESPVINQICISNTVTGGSTGIIAPGGSAIVLRDNNWGGAAHYGDLPGAALQVPARVLEVENHTATNILEVWNSGTDELTWSAATTSEWLTITRSGGSVVNEASEDLLEFTVNPMEVTPSEEEAIITVTGDSGQTKQITVEYNIETLPPPPPDPPPAPSLTGIAISGPAAVNEGTSAQYICTAFYSDGSETAVEPLWSETLPVTSIDGAGILTAGDVAADTNVVVTAVYSGYTNQYDVAILYVPVVVTGIEISGPTRIDEETTAQYTCTASYSDGSTAEVSPNWSDNSGNSSIDSAGLLTAGNVSSDENIVITADFNGQANSYSVTVSYVPPVLTGLVITGASTLDEETSEQYTCVASYSDGTSAVISPVWSENSAYASINSGGRLTAGNVVADQDILVMASFGGMTDTYPATILYVPPVLTGITISGPASILEGSSAQYTCTANYSDGTSAVVTPNQWTENSAYASVNASGLLTAGDVTASQSVTLSASYSGKSDTHAVSIVYIPPTVTGLSISGPQTVQENTTAQYVCTAYYSDGSSAQVNPAWSVPSPSASIDTSGQLATGNVGDDELITIHAGFEGQAATLELTVTFVGDQVVFPLSGFEGKTVSAELWDDVEQTMIDLGQEYEPQEIVIENINPGQWYWLGLSEYDDASEEWVLVEGRWIWM